MVSNKIVFDFLLDDHDAQARHNYLADKNGMLLHWDSGLAWRHGRQIYYQFVCVRFYSYFLLGPNARLKCKNELLCGTVEWQETANSNCTSICMFSKSTYFQMMDYDRGLVIYTFFVAFSSF
jgi:hypothetical protein